MKVYTVWTTDIWQTCTSMRQVGVFSTPTKARECIVDYIDEDTKVVINMIEVDTITTGEIEFEVYSLDSGLEEKDENSDLEINSKEMVRLTSSYYKIDKLTVYREDIETVINAYFAEMEYLGEEAEIKYMEVDEFLELDDTTINHVLYDAEQHDDLQLKNFFERLHKN